MRGAEGITAVDVRQLRNRGTELRNLRGVRLDLVAIRVLGLALLLDVVAGVLQQDHGARGRVSASRLDLRTDHIVQQGHLPAQPLLDDLGHRLHGVLLDLLAVRAAQVRAEHHRLRAIVQSILDGGQRRIDARRVRNFAGVLLVLGHVEVHADEDALALQVHLVDRLLRERAAGHDGDDVGPPCPGLAARGVGGAHCGEANTGCGQGAADSHGWRRSGGLRRGKELLGGLRGSDPITDPALRGRGHEAGHRADCRCGGQRRTRSDAHLAGHGVDDGLELQRCTVANLNGQMA
mmetsp:Transcript_76406/g.214979  ORF Transcript_76406/g.214979 Transcript_76406/m.214979 type:complete len:292 (-) Transcript_76406:12-887(-)